MTTTEQHSPDLDPQLVAAEARSILACPASISLVIEGEEHPVAESEMLGLSDHHGTPTFSCVANSTIALAAAGQRSALLTVTSGLGPRGGPERGDTLTLAGRLERTGFERCQCCDEERPVVSLVLSFALLTRPTPATPEAPERQLRVPLDEFRSRAHHLNRGHLQRSVEHANDCHQDELRQAVGTGTSTDAGDLLGVGLTRLTPAEVTIQWVDGTGAHQQVITFARAARNLKELGEMLRRGLHSGLC